MKLDEYQIEALIDLLSARVDNLNYLSLSEGEKDLLESEFIVDIEFWAENFLDDYNPNKV